MAVRERVLSKPAPAPVVVTLSASEAQDLLGYGDDRLGALGHHAFHKLGLIVEREEMVLDAKQRPREPEVALKRDPDGEIARLLSRLWAGDG